MESTYYLIELSLYLEDLSRVGRKVIYLFLYLSLVLLDNRSSSFQICLSKMKNLEGKVVVLGSQGVGKTSLVVRYIGKMFSHHISPTVGASFFSCTINVEDTRVKLQVWDTAGQERFRAMAPMYYRNANAALLVYDITQKSTFNSVKTWVKELKRNVEDPLVLCVVGNKTDLELMREVSREEAMEYSHSIAASYFEASALSDSGIDDVFLCCAAGMVNLKRDNLLKTANNNHMETAPPVISLLNQNNSNSATKKCC